MSRSDAELIENLREQVRFIKKSCAEFDNGEFSEAKRIATALRVTLFNKGNSVSILKQLDLESRIKLVNSVPDINPNNLLATYDFVSIRASTESISYVVTLGNSPFFDPENLISLDEWLNKPFMKDGVVIWSRSEFIRQIANKEGGAHLDPVSNNEYKYLVERAKDRWKLIITSNENELVQLMNIVDNIILYGIRQIAFEFLESIDHFLD